MPKTILEILEAKVLYVMMRIVCTTLTRTMTHMQMRRMSPCVLAAPVSDQDLAYSPGLRQFRDFQEPTAPGVSSWSMMNECARWCGGQTGEECYN